MTRRGSGTRRSTEKTAAASVDERMAPSEEGRRPAEVEEEAHGDGDDGHRHDDPDRRQDHRRARPSGGSRTTGRQAALGEDEDERGVPEHLGEVVGVELDPDAALAEEQADPEVEQRGTAARTSRRAGRRRRRR